MFDEDVTYICAFITYRDIQRPDLFVEADC